MGFLQALARKKNKTFAVAFSGAALIAFFAYYAVCEFNSGWTFFRADPWNLWDFAIYLLAYGIIFAANILNDNVAYRGILMFVFFTFLSRVFALFPASNNLIAAVNSGDPLLISLFVLFLALTLGQFAIGLLLYFWIYRYARGVSNDFVRVRVFAIVYAGILLASAALRGILLVLITGSFGPVYALMIFLLPISEVLMSVAIVFTLERLRRL